MLELRQEARLATHVNVLPQVVARASLLELGQDELEERVRTEVDRNPALELSEKPRVYAAPPQPSSGSPALDYDLFAHVPAATTLRDDLRWQLRAVCKGEQRRIADYIIESLDERGYLPCSVFDLADELVVPEERVEEALGIVQGLEPVGVGARDLAECLELQVLASKNGEAPPGLLSFLRNEFAELVKQKSPRALKSLKAPGTQTYLEFIRTDLYPYPADLYHPPYPGGANELPARTPDVIVTQDGDALIVTVPMSRRLVLRVDAAYERLARDMTGHKRDDDKADIRQLVAEAREFISNLTHRHTVLARVAAAVIQEQDGFLTHGPRGLRPFTKKELSRKVEMHESTICRATRGKTLMMPDGEVVPFDVFFEDALPTKVCLAQIIRREDPARPYTDTQLVEELAKHGYHVARRTVSKYRAAIDVPPTSQRRRRP